MAALTEQNCHGNSVYGKKPIILSIYNLKLMLVTSQVLGLGSSLSFTPEYIWLI